MRKTILAALAAIVLMGCAGSRERIIPDTFDPRSEFEQANKYLEKRKFSEARQLLNDIKRRDTEVEYAPLAQLRLADSYVQEDEPEIAVEEYRRFLADYPRHKHSAYAQYQVGKVYYDLITDSDRGQAAIVKALDAFKTLMRQHPRNPYREQVTLRIAECEKRLADYEFMVGNFYFVKGAYKGAVGRYADILGRFPDYVGVPEVLARTAEGYARLGDAERARWYLGKLRETYPDLGVTAKAVRTVEPLLAPGDAE
jgi:outer membrane protein assembly factor BamD